MVKQHPAVRHRKEVEAATRQLEETVMESSDDYDSQSSSNAGKCKRTMDRGLVLAIVAK